MNWTKENGRGTQKQRHESRQQRQIDPNPESSKSMVRFFYESTKRFNVL